MMSKLGIAPFSRMFLPAAICHQKSISHTLTAKKPKNEMNSAASAKYSRDLRSFIADHPLRICTDCVGFVDTLSPLHCFRPAKTIRLRQLDFHHRRILPRLEKLSGAQIKLLRGAAVLRIMPLRNAVDEDVPDTGLSTARSIFPAPSFAANALSTRENRHDPAVDPD
jgi:hypothetical protein